MSQYEYIIVDVSPTGEVSVKTEGFRGKKCLEAAQSVESALGIVQKIIPTAEMQLDQEQVQKNVANRKQ